MDDGYANNLSLIHTEKRESGLRVIRRESLEASVTRVNNPVATDRRIRAIVCRRADGAARRHRLFSDRL